MKYTFEYCTRNERKIRIVITFVALLELAKMEKIGIRESPDFNDFVIYGIANG